MPPKRSKRWSADAVAAQSVSLQQALFDLGLGDRTKPVIKAKTKTKAKDGSATASVDIEASSAPKKKRKGVSTAPILDSLKTSVKTCFWTDDMLCVRMAGARVLSYNEIYSILQFRKYEAMRYKTACRSAISDALKTPNTCTATRPFFAGPTALTLIRIGAKKMDRDALAIVFKHFLDALRKNGVIADDNPDIICRIETFHAVGEPSLTMALHRLPGWSEPAIPDWSDIVSGRYRPDGASPPPHKKTAKTKKPA